MLFSEKGCPPHIHFQTLNITVIALKLFLFLKKNKFVIRAGIQKMLVRIANREDPDQTASSELMLKN